MPLPGMVGDIQMFLLGDVFLRNYYSVYDFSKQMVRLAANSHSSQYVSIGPPMKMYFSFFVYSASIISFAIISVMFVKYYNKS